MENYLFHPMSLPAMSLAPILVYSPKSVWQVEVSQISYSKLLDVFEQSLDSLQLKQQTVIRSELCWPNRPLSGRLRSIHAGTVRTIGIWRLGKYFGPVFQYAFSRKIYFNNFNRIFIIFLNEYNVTETPDQFAIAECMLNCSTNH